MRDLDPNSEDWLDEQVRNVLLPEGLLGRLRATSSLDDEELDAVIRNVPVPGDLMDRLKTIPADGVLGRRLNRLSVMRYPAAQYAVAATLLISFSLAGLWLMSNRGKPGRLVDSSRAESNVETVATTDQKTAKPGASEHGASDRGPEPTRIEPAPIEIADADVAVPADPLFFENFPSPLTDLPRTETGLSETGSESERLALDEPFEPLEPLQEGRRKIIAYGMRQEVAELEPVPQLVARGVMAPPAKEFDRLRLIQEGVHPFVMPSENTILESVQVPLAVETTSFDMLRSYLARHRLPPSEEIRPEDFLAAVDYDFPRPENTTLGIVTAAGPSVFGQAERQLLQVAVQATGNVAGRESATQLIVAVDVSAGLGRAKRLDMLRTGLRKWFSCLGPDDRVTLIAMGEVPEILIDRAGSADSEPWQAALQRLLPHASCDLATGLAAVANLTGRTDQALPRQRIVLFACGLVDLPAPDLEGLEQLIRGATDDRTGWDAVDLKDGYSGDVDRRLEQLALAGRGKVWSVDAPRELAQAMTEVLLGRSTVVAKEARLTVRFNPDVVKRYRLIGHEAQAIGSLVAGPLEASFHLGDASTALFELELKATASSDVGRDDVAEATLVWRDARTGRRESQEQRIRRSQFAKTLEESPESLQMAAIAAAAAEILRASPYVSSESNSLTGVLQMARRLQPNLADNDSFREFLGTVELAQRGGRARP